MDRGACGGGGGGGGVVWKKQKMKGNNNSDHMGVGPFGWTKREGEFER